MSVPYSIQAVPNGPLVLHQSGYLTASLTLTNSSGAALTLQVEALILEMGVSSAQYPDVPGGHLFPGAASGQPLAYYEALSPTTTIQVPAGGQSTQTQWSSAPLVPLGSVTGATGILGVFWLITDTATGATGNLWSPNVVNVEYI